MTQVDDAWRQRRNRWLAASAAVAAVAAVLAVTASGRGQDRAARDGLEAVERAGVPVWYDARGLHRADVVEKTPIAIGEQIGDTLKGALALVRSGAVYTDAATGDVWFHPWGGDPRIVGRNSKAGPGGDPNGDTAAWFEGSDAPNIGPGELVVYNTAAGREISRTRQARGVADCSGVCGDHYPAGNGFLQVSTKRVVWNSRYGIYSHDVRTRKTTVKTLKKRYLIDVHDQVKLLGERNPWLPVLTVPGRAEQRYPDLETHARLSPSGLYVLAVEVPTKGRHGAVIVNIRTGKQWRVPNPAYPWISWSYGDIAMVDTGDQLLACDAARRTCERLRPKRPFLMPTN